MHNNYHFHATQKTAFDHEGGAAKQTRQPLTQDGQSGGVGEWRAGDSGISGPAGHRRPVLLPTHVDQQGGARDAAVHRVLWGMEEDTAPLDNAFMGGQKYIEKSVA